MSKKHDMSSTQLREIKKRRSLPVLKTTKKISFVSPNMHTENPGVIREKFIQGDGGNLSLDAESKKLAWKQHYECLLNVCYYVIYYSRKDVFNFSIF